MYFLFLYFGRWMFLFQYRSCKYRIEKVLHLLFVVKITHVFFNKAWRIGIFKYGACTCMGFKISQYVVSLIALAYSDMDAFSRTYRCSSYIEGCGSSIEGQSQESTEVIRMPGLRSWTSLFPDRRIAKSLLIKNIFLLDTCEFILDLYGIISSSKFPRYIMSTWMGRWASEPSRRKVTVTMEFEITMIL
jgi:hypothetical protein